MPGALWSEVVTALIDELDRGEHLVWLVGGVARDLIAEGRAATVNDIDLTGTALPAGSRS
jgi:hypothetical protein